MIRAFGKNLPLAKLLVSKNKPVNSETFTELYLGYGIRKPMEVSIFNLSNNTFLFVF